MTWTGMFRTEALAAQAGERVEGDVVRSAPRWAFVGAWLVPALVGLGVSLAWFMPLGMLGDATLVERLRGAGEPEAVDLPGRAP